MLSELETLMNFHSVTSDQPAVLALLDYVEGKLSLRGLTVERFEHEGRNSLYASTRGQHHARIMLQGHIDVVPGGEPFSQDGDKIYGRGCYDMLFATASFLYIIDDMDEPANYDISILLTGDEEIGGEDGVKALLDERDYSCDVCILPDAGEGLGTMSVAAKGIYDIGVRANGVSHHGSRPWEGDGAASKLVAFLSELSTAFDTSSHENSTYVVSQLKAGSSAYNQGPAEAFAGIDIRYKSTDDFIRIKERLNELCQKFSVDILYEEAGRNYSLDTSLPIVQDFVSFYASHVGKSIEFITSHGSSDARFFDDKGIPVIMLRPNGGNAHGDGEWLSFDSWQGFHQILAEYIHKTARQ